MCRRSGFRIAIRPSKSTASGIRPVWRIWRATRLSRSSTVRTICPSGSSFGWERAFDLAKAVADFAASTLARKKRELEKQLEALLAAPTGCDLARELQAKIGRARDQLLTFCDYPGEVDVTNNTSERKLRPCVIQRKVTNGYRAMWAAEAEADVRTTVDTARLKGANPFAVIVSTLA